MSLVAGTRLGPYEIQSAIGAGGMGEVYKARDTRLDRTVAIKIIPAELSADPDRRARFEREARAVAALSHPHICTLHDIGTHDGTTYLVMEHLAGETLAERLTAARIPLAQALDLAAQIAEALDAAHKHGIVHRDLKPGNVMLTTGGGPVGRDVGEAARLRAGETRGAWRAPGAPSGASVPTQAAPVTARGHDSRHAAVHGAGATGREGSRRADGPLGARRDALRDGDGPAGVRGRRAR